MRPISMNCWRSGISPWSPDRHRGRRPKQGTASHHKACGSANFRRIPSIVPPRAGTCNRTAEVYFKFRGGLEQTKKIPANRPPRARTSKPRLRMQETAQISVGRWKESAFEVRVRGLSKA
jgi:hypothetical protein